MPYCPPGASRLLVVVVVAAGTVFACSNSEPPPREGALIERFDSQREAFTAIAEWAKSKSSVIHLRLDPPDSQAAESQGLGADEIAQLGSWARGLEIESVSSRNWDPLELWLTVWYRDLFGPGGFQVAYAYCENEPNELVESIDPLIHPSLRLQTEAYRHLEGNWYLLYYAVD